VGRGRRVTSVIIVTNIFPNVPGDRDGNFIYESAASLAAAGISVSVLVVRHWWPRFAECLREPWLRDHFDCAAFKEFADITVIRHLFIPRNYFWRAGEWLQNRRAEPVLRELVGTANADLIHVHGEGLVEAAVRVGRQKNCPVVVTLHGIPTMRRFYDLPQRKTKFRAMLRSAARVVIVGEPLRPFYADVMGDEGLMTVVPNGVVLPCTPPKIILSETCIRFISVSNLNEGKGVDHALRGLARARDLGFLDWTYTIVGGGPEQRSLESLSTELGLQDRVLFRGPCPHQEIYAHLGKADVFLLPSYREGFGIAYLEAMAAGLLAIGVKGQGPMAFIEHGRSGLLVEPRSDDSVTQAVLTINADRNTSRRIAEQGSVIARTRFSWRTHADHLAALYGHVMAFG
jgi:glycosyltransferase involved in cell wall biosynthesis